jgi:energy-coupling factor transporter ATP-binding protein EcfA2
MSYTYYLPKAGRQSEQHETEKHSIIIIGANGSGKSRLGAWIESKGRIKIHRIGAQRILSWKPILTPRSYESSSNIFLYGAENINASLVDRNFIGSKDGKTYTERNDIDALFAAIFAKRTSELEYFDERMKKAPDKTLKREENIVDKIQQLWAMVFPYRNISFKDMKIIASIDNNEYNGIEMSDGERVALYLITQVLLIPENETIIIDEPETHLHRSIMNRLWEEIERNRPDCLFIYITHDTQFAANHKSAEKIWVKSFDGTNWVFEKIGSSDLPEQLLLDILGNRKPVIFVEGTSDSYDTKLYSAIYRDYYVVPCGGCSSVIYRTRAMNTTPQLSHIKVNGIIDRDFRSEYELSALAVDGIFAVKVAEVENIFLCEEVLQVINQQFGHRDSTIVETVKNNIIDERYAKQINNQICEAVVAEIKYKLYTADISHADHNAVISSLETLYKSISYDEIQTEKEVLFRNPLNNRDYKGVLAVFNCKELAKSIGHFFGIKNDEYCDLVLRLLCGEKSEQLRIAIAPYFPEHMQII